MWEEMTKGEDRAKCPGGGIVKGIISTEGYNGIPECKNEYDE
jgi:hypothetical protein